MEGIKITVPGQKRNLLQILIDKEYAPNPAAAAAVCFERGLPLCLEECLNYDAILSKTEPSSDLAGEFVKALAEKRKPDMLDVQVLADKLGVPARSLAELVTECCCNKEEEEANVKKTSGSGHR